jgi:flagellar protein FlaI
MTDGSGGSGRGRDLVSAVEASLADAAEAQPFADGPPDIDDPFLETGALDAHREVTGDWVNRPFAYTAVVRDEQEARDRFVVVEPALDGFEQHVREDLTAAVRDELLDESVTGDDDARFERHLGDLLADHAAGLPAATVWKLHYYFRRDFLGFGAVDPLMRDPAIEDISCDGADVPIHVYHRDHGNIVSNRSFGGDRLDSLTVKLAQRAGRHLSVARPLLTDTLPDGSRVQLTLGSGVATRGSNFTIRKFREEPFTPPELAALGTFTTRQLAYLWLAVEHNRSVLFAGPTASGKTTSMNVVTMFIPPDSKVVSIEETREVKLPHEDWIASVTRESAMGEGRTDVSMYNLLGEALHQRPEHILVGEIRTSPEVVRAFFQAMGTGHAGFSTFHAESPADVLRRLRHDPLSVPDELVSDLDLVSIQQQLTVDGESVRRCRGLVEVHEQDDGGLDLHETFDYDPYTDAITQVAPSRLLGDLAADRGYTDAQLREMLRDRQRVLDHLVATETFSYEAVSDWLFRFARQPEAVLDRIDEAGTVLEPDSPATDLLAADGGDEA